MSAARAQRRRLSSDRRRDERRLALQSTAELWRGLDVIEAELQAGQVLSAIETVAMLRAVVVVADRTLVEYLRGIA